MSQSSRKPTSARSKQSPDKARQQIYALLAVGVVLLLFFGCSLTTLMTGLRMVNGIFNADDEIVESSVGWAADSAELTVAVSPLMAPVLADLADQFNDLAQETPDNQIMTVRIDSYQPEQMVSEALSAPDFQAISPDSSLWLDRLEQEWDAQGAGVQGAGVQGAGAQQSADTQAQAEGTEAADESAIPIGQRRVAESRRYAVSPVVIAAWESVAQDLGWPDGAVGWETIQQQATADENFKWNHPSTNNASGLLATLAEFYAGAGLTRGLTEEAATAQETIDYVQAVESTIRFYGEGESVIVERLAQEGRAFLDAFVAQERVVIDWNRSQSGERLVAIYPAEGTLWTDHPLALLDLGSATAGGSAVSETAVTDNQRLVYRAFADFLTDESAQAHLLQAGYRPADLNIPLDAGDSPFANTDAVDWRQPQTTLQMPSPAVIEVVRNVWYYTKRPTNVFLVVDTSGSMEGNKIVRTREALSAFANQIQGERDQLGIIEFGSGMKTYSPLRVLDDHSRSNVLSQISNMRADGGTALIDAVYEGVQSLQAENDSDAINALVVMTDGRENESYYFLEDLQALVDSSPGRPPVIFTIAFGRDADDELLQTIADIGDGQFRRADETDIEELYRIISTYF